MKADTALPIAAHRPPIRSGTLPWTRSCFVCGESNPHGLRLRSRVEDGRVVLDYVTRPCDLGYRHLVHGGIAMTLMDEVMTWAAILAVRRPCVAAEMTTRLRRPILVDQPLRVEGQVKDERLKIMLTEGRILDATGQVLALSTGKYVPMPEDQIALCEKDFVISPESISLAELFG
jgi:uncharacterized protein (TIGR00369 family)